MTLKKRYPRSLRGNLGFYISTAVLTLVTLEMFYLFFIAGSGIKSFGETFFADHNLEDAHFTTYLPISEEELKDLEERYQVTLEAQRSMDITEDGITARVFVPNEKINLYEVTAGEDLSDTYDLLLSEGFAEANDVAIGDTMTIGGQAFTVVGYMQRPDYLYMLEDETDTYKNVTTFFLCYVGEEAFESLGTATVTYLVQYDTDNTDAFRMAINDTYYTYSYTGVDDNVRVRMVLEQADMFVLAAYVILVMLPLVAVILVCIMISRKIKDEQRLLGTLSAFGYTKGQLARHYGVFAALPGLVAGLLAFVVATIFGQSYGEMGLTDYEPLHVDFYLPVCIGLLGVIVPTVFYILAAMITTYRLLASDTVDMLNGKAGGKERLGTILRKGKLSFGKKFALRSLLGSPGRAFAVCLGIFLGSTILFFCLAIIDTMKYVAADHIDGLGTFEYEYILTSLQTGEPEEGGRMLVSNFTCEDGSLVTLMGIDGEKTYLDLVTEDGVIIASPYAYDGEVTSLTGYYLSAAAARTLGVSAGESLTLYNPLSLEEVTITIDAIVDYDMGAAIFTSLEAMAEILDMEPGTYNAIISDKELIFEDGAVRSTIRKSALIEQCDTILTQMGPIYYLGIGLGIITCIAAIYGVINMLVKENRGSISMLKILGYKDKEINRIILSCYHVLLPIGILLGIPAAKAALEMLWLMFLEYGVMLISTHIEPASYVLVTLMTSACYFGSLALVGRNTRKVSMEEALKDNRE